MPKQEDFRRPKKLLEKTREIEYEARISKKAEMKRKFNRNQKRITLLNIQLTSLIFLKNLPFHDALYHFVFLYFSSAPQATFFLHNKR